MPEGIIFDIAKFSIHDGPGIRTTVFFKGCQMNCIWCHNPEGISTGYQLSFQEERCISCGECIKTCPHKNPWSSVGMGLESECVLCGRCVEACSTGARKLIGNKLDVEEVLKVILEDKVFYDESGGGVTFSGGEPTMQPGFLIALLERCAECNIHTAVDTNGMSDYEILERIADRADLLLFDLKLINAEKHRKYTGVDNEKILENLRLLDSHTIPVIIRVPLVPGINDGEDDIIEMISFIRKLNRISEVNLLPYHDIGRDKFKRTGKDYKMPAGAEIKQEKIDIIKYEMEKAGFRVKIGG